MAFQIVSAGAARGGAVSGHAGGGASGAGRPVRGARDGPIFSVPDDAAENVAGAGPACETADIADVSLASMLALQEVDHPTGPDRRARRHADTMLAELRGLQLALLAGEDGADGLQRLATLVGSMPVATHPGLRAATVSVALRIELELVRHAAEMKA